MLLKSITSRHWFLLVAVICASLLGFALYKQYQDFLDPCPLCVIQRVAFMWIGAFALLAALHNPARLGQKVYGSLVLLGTAFGAVVAGRHVWLQSLPPDQVPECGPGLNYMLDNFPLTEVFQSLFFGSGSCAEVDWTFLGLSMPAWTLVWFLGLAAGTVFFTWRRAPE
ncbi:MAG: disulfide bond formation protein B [Xanthomonadales bacterium]|nr:disulfide bond formation protein B [Xanthomonadales bacterium]